MENKINPIRVIMGVMFGAISVIFDGYMAVNFIETGAKYSVVMSALLIALYINDIISVMWKGYRIKARRAEAKYFILAVFEIIILLINSVMMSWGDWILCSALFKATDGLKNDNADFIIGIANMIIIPITLIIINNIVIIISKCCLLINRKRIINLDKPEKSEIIELSEI